LVTRKHTATLVRSVTCRQTALEYFNIKQRLVTSASHRFITGIGYRFQTIPAGPGMM